MRGAHPQQSYPWAARGAVLPWDLSAEYRFLLETLSRFVAGGSGPRRWQNDARCIDSRKVAFLSVVHGVTSIIHDVCGSETGSGGMDVETRDFLRASRLTETATFLSRRLMLGESVTALAAAGIPSISLKGISLAERIYRVPGLRRTGDIDLLVEPGHLRKAVDALAELGFAPKGAVPDPFAPRAGSAYHVKLVKPGPAECLLELHWLACDDDIFNNAESPLDSARLWERSLPDPRYSGGRYLAPEDELLYLCGHAMKHNWRALYALVDIALYVQRVDLDWGIVEQRRSAFGPTWAYDATLLICSGLLGARLPQPVADRLEADWAREPRLRRFVKHVVTDWILADRLSEVEGPFLPWERYVRVQRSLAMMERTPVGMIRHVLRQLTSPDERDVVLISVPPKLACVRRIVRPLRLASVHSRYLLWRVRSS